MLCLNIYWSTVLYLLVDIWADLRVTRCKNTIRVCQQRAPLLSILFWENQHENTYVLQIKSYDKANFQLIIKDTTNLIRLRASSKVVDSKTFYNASYWLLMNNDLFVFISSSVPIKVSFIIKGTNRTWAESNWCGFGLDIFSELEWNSLDLMYVWKVEIKMEKVKKSFFPDSIIELTYNQSLQDVRILWSEMKTKSSKLKIVQIFCRFLNHVTSQNTSSQNTLTFLCEHEYSSQRMSFYVYKIIYRYII